jgi:hypothetical protein
MFSCLNSLFSGEILTVFIFIFFRKKRKIKNFFFEPFKNEIKFFEKIKGLKKNESFVLVLAW